MAKIYVTDLEKILDILPEPAYVKLKLYNFDHSGISEQAKEIVSNIEIIGNDLIFDLKNPKKETILEIYRKSDNTNGNEIIDAAQKGKLLPQKICLREISWVIGEWNGCIDIKLTPTNLNIKYRTDEEPPLVSKLKKELSIRTETEVNGYFLS